MRYRGREREIIQEWLKERQRETKKTKERDRERERERQWREI